MVAERAQKKTFAKCIFDLLLACCPPHVYELCLPQNHASAGTDRQQGQAQGGSTGQQEAQDKCSGWYAQPKVVKEGPLTL